MDVAQKDLPKSSPTNSPALNCPNCPPQTKLAIEMIQAENEILKLRLDSMWSWVNSNETLSSNIPDFGEVEDLKNQLAEQKLAHLEEISKLQRAIVPVQSSGKERNLQIQLAKKQRSHNQERQNLHNTILDQQQFIFFQNMAGQAIAAQKTGLYMDNCVLWTTNGQLGRANATLRERSESQKCNLHSLNQELNEERRLRLDLEKKLAQTEKDKVREIGKVKSLRLKLHESVEKNQETIGKMEAKLQVQECATNEEKKQKILMEAEMKKLRIGNNVFLAIVIFLLFVGFVSFYFFSVPRTSSKLFESSIFETFCNITNASSL